MQQEIKLNYFNEELKIGLVSWREAYQLFPAVRPLNLETYRGRIIHRLKGSSKRVSYKRMKKGLVKKSLIIQIEVPDWIAIRPL